MPTTAIDAILEIFTWVGFGSAALIALIALIVRLADGSWRPTQAVIGDAPDGPVARWFGTEGAVGQARLSHEQEKALAGRDVADVWVRNGRSDRLRLTRGSPAVRFLLLLAAGLGALGLVASIVSIVMVFVR